MADDIDQNPEQFRQQARQHAEARPVAYEDFYYLLGRYPYLEISHPEATHYPTTPPRIKQSNAGWDIHYYDQLIVSSQSALLMLLRTGVDLSHSGIETLIAEERQNLKLRLRAEAKASAEDEDSDEGEGSDEGVVERKPVGTIVNQFFSTAFEMAAMARQNNWPGIRIIRGYYPMQRAAWIACETFGITCEGFDPTPEDHVVYSWVKSLAKNTLDKITAAPRRR